MAKWNYTLKNSSALRQAIHDEDPKAVLDALEKAWTEIHTQFEDEYDWSDLENDLEDINNERDNLDYYEDYDMSYDDVIDNIDYLVNNLYDFCDNMRIWIEF